jgi:hypothetical protein
MSQNFGIKVIQRRSSTVNLIMEVLTTEGYLWNPELNSPKVIGIFTKPYLQSACKVVSIDSLVQEKCDDYSLIILHQKHTLDGF